MDSIGVYSYISQDKICNHQLEETVAPDGDPAVIPLVMRRAH